MNVLPIGKIGSYSPYSVPFSSRKKKDASTRLIRESLANINVLKDKMDYITSKEQAAFSRYLANNHADISPVGTTTQIVILEKEERKNGAYYQLKRTAPEGKNPVEILFDKNGELLNYSANYPGRTDKSFNFKRKDGKYISYKEFSQTYKGEELLIRFDDLNMTTIRFGKSGNVSQYCCGDTVIHFNDQGEIIQFLTT